MNYFRKLTEIFFLQRNRNLVTPSNGSKVMSRKDQFTTPQRMSMAPQSRMSLAGTASKRMSGK